MIFKQEITRMIKPSTDDEAVQETLITPGTIDEEANMARAKVKMEEVREENERLKQTLSQMMKDYQSLKMQFNGITQEDHSKKPTNLSSMAASDDESELVSLSLGRVSADHSKREEMIKKNNNNNSSSHKELDGLNWKLNLDSSAHDHEDSMNLRPNESSLDESKEEGSNGGRSPRGSPLKSSRAGDDDVLQQNPLKKPRVSVRAVCNTQTMHDGCQWRKYGQKIAKGNPCPRAYYRCTVSSSCPVRKQVQRCIDDMSILVTTYEGTHNHPLPPSAATMASATSAAVAMLSCGSSTSPPRSTTPPSTNPSLLGFNFTSSNTNTFPRATISTSQSHPTVILDLTAPNHSNKFTPTIFSTPTSLNFSSFDPKISWESKFPTINSVAYNPRPPLFPKQATTDQKIAAATKAITHDPTFQSALAAAITSFVGNNNMNASSTGMNLHLNFAQPSPAVANASIGCAATFMNRFPQPMNSQQKSLTDFAPLALSASKSQQALSLADEGEKMKL